MIESPTEKLDDSIMKKKESSSIINYLKIFI